MRKGWKSVEIDERVGGAYLGVIPRENNEFLIFGGENEMVYMKKAWYMNSDFEIREADEMISADYFYDNMYFPTDGGIGVMGYCGLHILREGEFVSFDPSKGSKYIEDN